MFNEHDKASRQQPGNRVRPPTRALLSRISVELRTFLPKGLPPSYVENNHLMDTEVVTLGILDLGALIISFQLLIDEVCILMHFSILTDCCPEIL